MTQATKSEVPAPALIVAILPLAITLALVATQLFVFDDVSPHIPLALGIVVTAAFGLMRGYSWAHMQDGMFRVIQVAMPAIFILYTIGMIIGVWIQSGTVPLLIYYGLKVLDPSIFLFASCIICSIVSVATGTSWGTTGTMGLALIGIGQGLGIPVHMTAGAVVSGAFFGDKMSPLSDTTNFAPAVVGTDLWTHIRNMLPVTLPAMAIALGAYLYLGGSYSGNAADASSIEATLGALQNQFSLSPLLLIPPAVVMYLAITKRPALPGLFAGVLVGAIVALIVQGAGLHDVWNVILNGYKSDTGIAQVDSLLSKGGLMSMNWTVTLVLIALAFGGLLESTRCLETILFTVLQFARTRATVMLSALGSVLGVHVMTGEVFLSMALPGRMFAPAFRGQRIHVANLSRLMEDAGTLSAPLIPWSAGGVFVATTLGVGTLAYLPWAIACWASVLIDIVYSLTGLYIRQCTESDYAQWRDLDESVCVNGAIIPGSQVAGLGIGLAVAAAE